MTDHRNTPNVPPTTEQSRVIRSPFFREAYGNNFRFRLSPIDFTIVFSSNTEMPGIALQDEASVNMSIPAAKILTLHLSKMIAAIEHEIGAIRIPKAAVPTEQQTQELVRSLRENPLTEG